MSSTRRVAAVGVALALVAAAGRVEAAARTVTLLGVSGVDGARLLRLKQPSRSRIVARTTPPGTCCGGNGIAHGLALVSAWLVPLASKPCAAYVSRPSA